MRNLLLCFVLVVLVSCGQKKIDFSGDTPIKTKDFIAAFKIIPGNFYAADSNFTKIADTVTMGFKAITQFVPDTAITKYTGKDKKPQFHPVGRILKEKEIYFLINIKQHNKITLLVIVMNAKDNKYLASKLLLETNQKDDYVHSVTVNKEPTFLISKEKAGKDNTMLFSRTGWVYTTETSFMIVVNDSNEGASKTNVINPIDTLPRKNKLSADYAEDAKNFISIRDGKNANTYNFFIHFEKNDGGCIGELKGEMKMKDPTHGQYLFNGDPCVIDFKFEDAEIKIKEQGTCGNHRGIKCFFDDTYLRKKAPRTNKRN